MILTIHIALIIMQIGQIIAIVQTMVVIIVIVPRMGRLEEIIINIHPERLINASLFFSGKCGLSCSYCYIGKGKSMASIDQSIQEDFKNRGIANILKENYDKDLEDLSLWGAETTENLGFLIDQLEDVLESFPKLSRILISSNFYKQKSVDLLIDLVNKTEQVLDEKRDFLIDIQCSIDGPSWISDISRQTASGKGVTDVISKNIGKLIEEVSSLPLKNLRVDFKFKSTVDMSAITHMVNNDDLFLGYWQFFDSFGEKIRSGSKQFRFRANTCSPTVIIPGDYTYGDALVWSKYLEKCVQHSKENNPYKYINNKNITPYMGTVSRVLLDSDTVRNQNQAFSCGASAYGYALGTGRRAHVCHRSFFLEDDNYMKFSEETKDKYEVGREKLYRNKFMQSRDNKEAFLRQQYVTYGQRDFMQSKYSYIMTSLFHLARYGQADEDYIWDEEYRKLTSLFILGGADCIMEGYFMTGSFHMIPQEIIKLWGGGAVKVLAKEYWDRIRGD